VRAVRRFWSIHSQRFEFQNAKKEWMREDSKIHKDKKKNAYEKLKANDFIQNYSKQIQICKILKHFSGCNTLRRSQKRNTAI